MQVNRPPTPMPAMLPWLPSTALIVVFGLYIAGVLKIDLLTRTKRFEVRSRPAGLVGSFAVGLTFAIGWTPCVGPMLGSILTLASNDKTIAQVRTIVAGVNKIPEDQVDMTNLIALLDVREEYLQAAFDAVDEKYGSFDAYLIDGLGLTEAQVEAFRDSMLE